MCCAQSAVTKQETVLRKLDTLPQDEQYTMKVDDEKNNIYAGRRGQKKKNTKTADADTHLAADVLYQRAYNTSQSRENEGKRNDELEVDRGSIGTVARERETQPGTEAHIREESARNSSRDESDV